MAATVRSIIKRENSITLEHISDTDGNSKYYVRDYTVKIRCSVCLFASDDLIEAANYFQHVVAERRALHD